MKKTFAKSILLLGGVLIFLISGCDKSYSKDVNTIARQASVQTVFHIPIMKAYFTDEWKPEKPEYVEIDRLKELIQEKLDKALEKQKKLENETTHNSYLTAIDKYGVEPVSATVVPLSPLAPNYAKFPKRVIVAVKVEKEEITPWDKEYEKDVLSISETANVSPSAAKDILSRLRSEGYTVSKDAVVEAEETTLLWFDDGWGAMPRELDWSVTVEGSETNIIERYDALNALLITKPIPEVDGEYKRVHVTAGYFDLIQKPDSEQVKLLKEEIEDLKETIAELEDEIEKLTEEEEEKRDIRDATWFDVINGYVTVEQFWALSAASGVFLGNMKARKEFTAWGNDTMHSLNGEVMGVILTNAHVAEMAMRTSLYVSEDQETMWIVFPGYPFIRYTQDSDYYGSPAKVLCYDEFPISSWGCDTAAMVTTAVPGYENYRAILGNSDNVKEGDEIIMVGNPALLQKYSFKGVITNKAYSILKSFMAERFFKHMTKSMFDWASNSSMWFDCEGTGGTSGSGVWAVEGSEKGKVIALHNMGMVTPTSISRPAKEAGKKLDPKTIWDINGSLPLADAMRGKGKVLFKNYSYRDAQQVYSFGEFVKAEPEFDKAIQKHSGVVDMPGMNAGIPINKSKRYLAERGLDIVERLDGRYYAR